MLKMANFRIKVRNKGEITIPKKLRDEMKIEKNDILDVDYKNRTIILSIYPGKK